MTAKPAQIIKTMDVLNDLFIDDFEKPYARGRAEAELAMIESIEDSDLAADAKCEHLFDLLRGDFTFTGGATLFG